MKFVVASMNPDKLRELGELLGDADISLVGLRDFTVAPDRPPAPPGFPAYFGGSPDAGAPPSPSADAGVGQ